MKEFVCERQGTVAYVQLNRPEVRNALSLALIIGLTDCIKALNDDPTVRVIVLSGNGRHFCAGADLEWMRASVGLDAAGNLRDAQILGRLFAALDSSPKPIVGNIHGAAIGGGAGLVAVCDYVLAREDAFFCFSEVRLGLIPAVISPYVLAKIGPSAARAYFTSAERFTATRARELGLVHEVVAAEEHDGALARIIQSYLRAAPLAIRSTKMLLHNLIYERPSTKQHIDTMTSTVIATCRVGDEAQQGIAAFLDDTDVPWQQ